jgi:septal ring-binding cell division protein DamX
MRFEIRSGGVAAILVGLALLSGAVFVLGLLAGYDVGRESQVTTEQVATAYPVQAPPAAAQTNGAMASAATPATESAAPKGASAATSSDDDSDGSGSGIDESNLGGSVPHGSEAVAQTSPTATASPSAGSEPPGNAADSSAGAGIAAAEHPHPERHKPYNIQIRAAMDLNGGNAMMRRLEGLGYQAHLVPTQIAGATWYRVEIGPYASQQDAAAAETELRQKYNSSYGGARPAAQAAANTTSAAQPQSTAQSTAQTSN